jgi:hypothetical protein
VSDPVTKDEFFQQADKVVEDLLVVHAETHPQVIMLACYKIFTQGIDAAIDVPEARTYVRSSIEDLERRLGEWRQRMMAS